MCFRVIYLKPHENQSKILLLRRHQNRFIHTRDDRKHTYRSNMEPPLFWSPLKTRLTTSMAYVSNLEFLSKIFKRYSYYNFRCEMFRFEHLHYVIASRQSRNNNIQCTYTPVYICYIFEKKTKSISRKIYWHKKDDIVIAASLLIRGKILLIACLQALPVFNDFIDNPVSLYILLYIY